MDFVSNKKTYPKFSVFHIMTPAPITISPDTTASEALQIMETNGFHHLPVVEKHPSGADRIVGMVAKGDLQRVISVFIGTKIETNRDLQTLNLHVKSFMSKKVFVIPPETGIRECVDLLMEKGFNSVPIVDAKTSKLVGIVTSTDLLKFLYDLLGRGLKT